MIILASASPRRQELLKLITDDFIIKVADIDESLDQPYPPDKAVETLAYQKASEVLKIKSNDIVIGADTIVSVDYNILGKPKDSEEALGMLTQLSGRKHQVYTGVAILSKDFSEVFSVSTDVEFDQINLEEIKRYISTGEPFDKAGAYGIQGHASKFVKSVTGDYFNIVGLPVNMLYKKLKELEII